MFNRRKCLNLCKEGCDYGLWIAGLMDKLDEICWLMWRCYPILLIVERFRSSCFRDVISQNDCFCGLIDLQKSLVR